MTPGIPAHVATLSSDLQLAATAAFDAGEIIRNGYDQLHEVKLKGIGDLVSEVDQNADREYSPFDTGPVLLERCLLMLMVQRSKTHMRGLSAWLMPMPTVMGALHPCPLREGAKGGKII